MAHWTVDDMPDQHGRTVLVTGANSGLGLGVSKAFARKGARVILACRSPERGAAAVDAVKAQAPDAEVELVRLDLADLDQVRAAADEVKRRVGVLDVLVNNAGVMMVPKRETTAQGHELQFGVNHLGHFVLTGALLPLLEAAPAGRVVTVSSMVARMPGAKIDFDDPALAQRYQRSPAYGQSKLANAMFAAELQARLEAAGSKVISVAAHPGWTATGLQRHLGLMGPLMNALGAQKLEMGILPLLRAATDPEVRGGDYYGPSRRWEMRGYPRRVRLPAAAEDVGQRQRLWALTESLTGTPFALAA